MFTEKGLAIIGVFLLAVGMFLPAWSDGDDSSSNLIDLYPERASSTDGPGVYVLILVVVTLLLILMDCSRYTWATTLLAFLPLFLMFLASWGLMLNDLGSLGIGWSAILVGLILMSAPFWPESLKTYVGWLETEDEGAILEEHSEPIQGEQSMGLRRVLILIGLAAILIGCLVPIYEEGDSKYLFLSGRYWGSSPYVLFALITAFAALAMKKDEMLWVFGLIILGWLVNDLRLTRQYVLDAENARLWWGWLLLINGALALTITLFLGEDRERLGMVFGPVTAFFARLSPLQPPEEEDEESGDEPAAPDETSEDSQDTSAE
jgi:hypothetical protein